MFTHSPSSFGLFRSNFELVSTFRGHRSPVIFLDWSEDGAYIQSCDERGGFMYWDSMSGVQVGWHLALHLPFFSQASSFLFQVMQDFDLLRGSPWHTWTCTHGWAVTGLVPKVAGGTPVHAVSRSHRGDIMAVADDFGLVCFSFLFLSGLIETCKRNVLYCR
jgi:hypothetical protein